MLNFKALASAPPLLIVGLSHGSYGTVTQSLAMAWPCKAEACEFPSLQSLFMHLIATDLDPHWPAGCQFTQVLTVPAKRNELVPTRKTIATPDAVCRIYQLVTHLHSMGRATSRH
jgi:hypothetical protein